MSKQRVRADNFEQLIEIVKAVQRGKDPEESLREKEEQELRELLEQEEGEEDLPDEERTPEEQQADERALGRLLHRLVPGDERDGDPEIFEEESSKKKISERESTEQESSGKENFGEEISRGKLSRKKTSAQKASRWRRSGAAAPEAVKESSAKASRAKESSAKESSVEASHATESSAKASRVKESSTKASRVKESSTKALHAEESSVKASPAEGSSVKASHERGSTAKTPFAKRLASLGEKLAQKGFRHKEILFAGTGLLLAILVIALVAHAVLLNRMEKSKMEGVTADEGLTVLIEKKPEQWCSSFPVELTVRTKAAKVERATVNGTSYMLDEEGRLTAKVSEPVLEVSVDTGQETLRAQVEIPMIDAQPPVINVTRQQDQITVTAGDARSEIAKIRYAVVHNNALSDVPEYLDYSEPLTFEQNCVYYFYAQDEAGNRCRPLVTTMESAKSLRLSQEEAELYPEETIWLEAQVEPEGALLNNLRYTSANPEVVTVDSSGKVTATGVGSTVVTVSADEISEASCRVTVGESRSVTISAIGDCTLGTDVNLNSSTGFDAFDVVNGHSWFFQNVRDILSEDDATFANMEGTLTTETQRENKEYAFKGDPSYTQILKNGSIDVVTLANNHSSDYGPQSLADTKQYLTEAGIDYCQDTEIAVKDVNGIPTAFIGIYVLDDGMNSEQDLRDAIAEAKEQQARLIIVAFHWGSEKETQPDSTQQELAHIAVDCGANLVVGHHPHVLQGIEKYNGAYIVYSLGNFCFGGNNTPSDMDTMIFRQTFTVTRDAVLDDDQIEIIPCSISSEAYYNNYQPTPAQDAEAQRIIGRINEYSAMFGMSYSTSGETAGSPVPEQGEDGAANPVSGETAGSPVQGQEGDSAADPASDEVSGGV